MSQKQTGARTPDTLGPGSDFTLFPSRLPWIVPPRNRRSSKKHRRGHSTASRSEAFEWLHRIWVYLNFLDAGSPCSTSAAVEAVDKASRSVWTTQHETYARAMYAKLTKYCACPRGTLERGSAKLSSLIEKIQCSQYDPSISFDEAASGALPVNPHRISLPEHAGILDPTKHLKGKRLEQFLNMPQDVPESRRSNVDPPACHKVSDEDWPVILRKLHQADMITFIKKSDVLRDGKKLIKGGLFCVPHKPTSDRLINDRRPANLREKRLEWCQLPSGPLLCQLILEKHQSVRASGDDLSNYFYLIRHLETWQSRNCFGTQIRGSRLRDLGLSPSEWYLPAFKVVCMGDTNGVDIAQATHEAILQEAGCLKKSQTLIHGQTFPASDTLEGLYIDDHLAFQIVDTKPNRDRGVLGDETIMRDSREKYKELNLPRSEKKAFDKSYCFKAWGTSVDSCSGRIGSPTEKLRQIESLTTALLTTGHASKKALQKLIGLYIHPFMHRRECMSVFHHIYVYLENMKEGVVQKLPHHIRDELVAACLLLPVACGNVRWPVSVQISATDASLTGGGRASTVTSRKIAKTLYRFGEKKGEFCKLDWASQCLPPPTSMVRAPDVLVDALMCHAWTPTEELVFRRASHINLLEMEMLKREIQSRVNSGRGQCRMVNLCDSRVVVGAYAKGRSSSKQLNHLLKKCCAWSIAGDLSVTNIWVDTKRNPADHPSRGKPIPPPDPITEHPLFEKHVLRDVQVLRTPAEQEMLEQEAQRNSTEPFHGEKCLAGEISPVEVKKNTTVCDSVPIPTKLTFREIFAGKARLSAALRKVIGVTVLDPVDYMKGGIKNPNQDILNDAFFEQLKKEAKRKGQLWHFGLPCSSFSILQHSNGGTRRREHPWGLDCLAREIEGNEILRRTIQLIKILQENGSYWTLENPHSSYVWYMPAMVSLQNKPGANYAVLDQCAYGLRIKGVGNAFGPCKKRTRIVGNLPNIAELSRNCGCRQQHIHAVGGVRTKTGWKRRSELAGHYPRGLAQKYADLASHALC